VIGPVAGFFGLGALGAFLGARADPNHFIIMSNGTAIGILAGVAIGVTAGVLIGRWADHHYTTIEIVP
jgi:ABC-type dipeptide/oligopeptide/nickel transport system permease component